MYLARPQLTRLQPMVEMSHREEGLLSLVPEKEVRPHMELLRTVLPL